MKMELVAPNEEQRIRRGRSTNVDRLATRTQAVLGTEIQPVASSSSGWNNPRPQSQIRQPRTTTTEFSVDGINTPIERCALAPISCALFSNDFIPTEAPRSTINKNQLKSLAQLLSGLDFPRIFAAPFHPM